MFPTLTISGDVADEIGAALLDCIATARQAVILPDGGRFHGNRAFRPSEHLLEALISLRHAAAMSWSPAAQLAIDEAREEKAAPLPRVVIVIEGGNVQSVLTDFPAQATTIDYDVEGVDPVTDDSYAIPQDDGTTSEALRYTFDSDVEPAWITAALAAELAMPDDLDDDQRVARAARFGVTLDVEADDAE